MAYRTLSPDGFDLTHECKAYRSIKQARIAIAKWVENYRGQGYYSQTCWNGYVRHISLTELPDYCDIIKI
jgi:hypothetical protein